MIKGRKGEGWESWTNGVSLFGVSLPLDQGGLNGGGGILRRKGEEGGVGSASSCSPRKIKVYFINLNLRGTN